MDAGAGASARGKKKVRSERLGRPGKNWVKETRRGPNIGKELSERESRVGRLVTAAFDLSCNGQGWGEGGTRAGSSLSSFARTREREKNTGTGTGAGTGSEGEGARYGL
jgi:hypothetical protein